jgi:hypothetical protein
MDITAGQQCKENRKRKRKKTIWLKSGQSNRKKILSALVTSGTKNPIKTTAQLTMEHQLYPSLSNSHNNHQCCNSPSSNHSQSSYRSPCYHPNSPSYCHHNLRPFSLTSPHYCHRHRPDSPPKSQGSSSPCRRLIRAHRNFVNVSTQLDLRLFRRPMKKTKLLSSPSSRRREYQLLRYLHRSSVLSYSSDMSPHLKYVDLQLSKFETLFNDYPFHLLEVNDQGYVRYRLTRLEKEHLQSLGLSQKFPTSFPKPDLLRSEHDRWKKNLQILYFSN